MSFLDEVRGQPVPNEQEFQTWYADRAARLGLDPNPDNPQHFYDYRAAHAAGAEPDQTGHWPSEFKREGHPRMIVDGLNTKTGQPASFLEEIQNKPTAFAQEILQGMQPGQDKADRGNRLDPALANQRYSGVGDMNEKPRGLVDDRIQDESWADAVSRGAYSIAGSVYEGLGFSAASVFEGSRRAYDAAIGAMTSDADEQAFLQDVVARETDYGMRSEWASIIRQHTRLAPEDVVPGFWTQDLPNAIGYTAAFLGGGLAGAAVRVPIWLSAAALGASTGGLSGFEDAKAHGATTEQAATSYLINAAAGTSEAIPIFRVFDRLNSYSAGALNKFFGREVEALVAKYSVAGTITKETAQGILENGLQEVFQQGMENWSAADKRLAGYDPERSLGENIGLAGVQGGTVGGMISLAAAGLGLKMRGTPLESTVDKLARERKAQGVDLEQLKQALYLKQTDKLLSEDVTKLRDENQSRVDALTPEGKDAYDAAITFFSYGNLGQPWISGTSHPVEEAARGVVFPDGTEGTLIEFANSSHNLALSKNTKIVLGTEDTPAEVARARTGMNKLMNEVAGTVEAFRNIFSKTTGEETPKIVVAFNDIPEGGTSTGAVSAIRVKADGTLGLRHGTDGKLVFTLFIDPKNLVDDLMASGEPKLGTERTKAFANTLSHEFGHILFGTRLYAASKQAYIDLQAGLTTSPAIREYQVIKTVYQNVLLDTIDSKTTIKDFVERTGDFNTKINESRWTEDPGVVPGEPGWFLDGEPHDAHVAIVEHDAGKFEIKDADGKSHGLYNTLEEAMKAAENAFPVKSQPAMRTLLAPSEKYETVGSYYANPHEVFARLFARYIGGVSGTPFSTTFAPFSREIAPIFKRAFDDIKEFYDALPSGSKRHLEFSRFLDQIVGQKKLENSLTNPVGLTFVQGILKGNLSNSQITDIFKGWNTDLDKFNSIIRWGAGLHQVVWLNPHIRQAVAYLGKTQAWSAFHKKWEAKGVDLVKAAKSLGKERNNRVFNALLEQTTGGKFFTPEQLAQRLADPESLAVFHNIEGHFKALLPLMEGVVIEQTKATFTDPIVQAQRVADVRKAFAAMKTKPYFPLMRFGKYGIKVRDKTTGKMEEFHLFESQGEQADALAELRKEYGANYSVSAHEMKDFELGSQGLPYKFIQALEDKFGQMGVMLSNEQKAAMKELSYEFLPSKSFLRKFKHRKGIEGYSHDGMRVIGAYTQNAIGYIARAKFGVDMQKDIENLENEADFIARNAPDEVKDMSKREPIARMMARHYKYIMEPGSEWANLRSLGFTFYLGYNVKSAVINLTQVPLITYSHLAAKHGDLNAVRALARANGVIVKYLRDPKSLSDDEYDLMRRGREEGWLDESLGATLAVMGTDGVLDRMLPINSQGKWSAREAKKIGKHVYYKAAEWGAFPFHMVEKYNRAVTALASHQLAMEKGMSHDDAVNSARESVQRTQYEYARWARPELMRGKKGSLFLFKSYLQGTLFYLYNDPGAWRYLAMLAVVGGLQGLPFAEDLLDLMDTSGTWFKEKLGMKDSKVDLRTELRRDAAEFMQGIGANPDMLFRGISSQSFGLGMLGDALGVPIPNIDLSGSLSMGNIIPGTDIFKKLSGKATPQEFVGQMAEDVAGPLGSMGMGIVAPFLRDDPNAWRRWERALPLFMRNASKAMRMAEEGQEETAGGSIIASFDIHDPRDRMELVLQTFGFTPTRVSRGWQQYMAELEATQYWTARKSLLTMDFNYASEQKDREGQADAVSAIKEYNNVVPYPAMKVSMEDLKRSHSAYMTRRIKLSRGQALQADFVQLHKDYAEAYAVAQAGDSPRTSPTPSGPP